MPTLIVAGKQPRQPGILDANGDRVISAINHKIVKIGKVAFWHEGGIIHYTDEESGEWSTITPTVFMGSLTIFKEIFEGTLKPERDKSHLAMKLELLGAKSLQEVKKWYYEGKELVREAFEHGAPEDPQGPERHKGRMAKWFRF